MRCQRFNAFRRLTSLICFLRDATAAFFNPPSLPIFRMKSGELNDDAPTADDATIYPLQGGKAALDACQRLGVLDDYQLDPGRAEQAIEAELPEPPRWLQAYDLGRVARRQSRNVIDGFERYPERRKACPQNRAQIIGRTANAERLLGHRSRPIMKEQIRCVAI